MIARKKFHVDHDVRPAHVTAILKALSPFVGETRPQLLAYLAANDHPINPHYLLWNLKVMRALGLADADERTDSWRLTRRGVYLSALAEWNQRAFHDMMHYLYYAAWDCGDREAATFSWTYQTVCNLLWQRRPSVIDGKALAAEARDLARKLFGYDDVSITDYAVDGVYNWLRMLNPPFAWTDTRKRRRETNGGRSDCTPELFLMAVDYLYRTRSIPYGQTATLNDERTGDICRVCLLDPLRVRAVLGRTVERFAVLRRFASPNGLQVLLERPPRLIVWPGGADTQPVDLDSLEEMEPLGPEEEEGEEENEDEEDDTIGLP